MEFDPWAIDGVMDPSDLHAIMVQANDLFSGIRVHINCNCLLNTFDENT